MYTEKLAINDSSKDEEVKHVTASLPDGCIAVLLLTLLIETVNLCDLSRLVVAANEHYTVRISATWISNSPQEDVADVVLLTLP
jgi:hypothetical protein